jgi:sulfur transfer protein SufE
MKPDKLARFLRRIASAETRADRIQILIDTARQTISGAPLEQVAMMQGDVVYEIFGRELSMGKSAGLQGMVAMVAREARKTLEGPAPIRA